ncbi:hypothetical protein BDN71DRAFT_1213420 [Pleurotus eryngii]|uniref:Uncharacterized protein n=1 Tax=Pleurotus eryngii TaxID=5323 RepID=A0A9P6D5V5_PLEER|nr:hypothetical protein BDN71DRAFT_1213420 [Pleurotus eryngii]
MTPHVLRFQINHRDRGPNPICTTGQESYKIAPMLAFPISLAIPVNACYLVQCSQCGKTTWAGCGQHIASAMKDVKDEDKCTCPR